MMLIDAEFRQNNLSGRQKRLVCFSRKSREPSIHVLETIFINLNTDDQIRSYSRFEIRNSCCTLCIGRLLRTGAQHHQPWNLSREGKCVTEDFNITDTLHVTTSLPLSFTPLFHIMSARLSHDTSGPLLSFAFSGVSSLSSWCFFVYRAWDSGCGHLEVPVLLLDKALIAAMVSISKSNGSVPDSCLIYSCGKRRTHTLRTQPNRDQSFYSFNICLQYGFSWPSFAGYAQRACHLFRSNHWCCPDRGPTSPAYRKSSSTSGRL